MTDQKTPTAEPKRPVSKSAWTKAGVHTITCASGVVIDIKLPNLPEMVSAGEFPNHLVDAAIAAASATTEKAPSREDIEQQAEFYRELVAKTVVEPKITPEDVQKGLVPFEDVELIVAIATRNRDFDALGHHLGGLHEVEDWRKFRGLDDLD